jgi:hypothetical protein
MYSREHKQFLKKIKREKLIVRSIQILILLLFLFLWQLAASKGWINSFITSSPKEIINTLIKLSNDNLFEHIWVTIYETFISFGLGTIIGIFIATILWWNHYLFKIFDPYLTILNSLPKVALGPIIIIWCGSGIKSIIIMALLISVIITIINISVCFNSVDSNKIKLLKSFQATKNQLFFKLIFPSSITSIVSSLKINISMSLIGVIMGEFLVSKKGIGYLILYGSQTFNLNLVMTGIIVLCIVAALMYYIVLYLEKKLNK